METEKQNYALIQTYLLNKYFISTIYRQCSAVNYDGWYFETIVWAWDGIKRERGEMLDMEDSGISEAVAITNHLKIIEKLHTR